MPDDNVKKFPSPKAVELLPDDRVVKLLEAELENARSGDIDFVMMVIMPRDDGAPVVSWAGDADPYRVAGAFMHAVSINLGEMLE